MIDVRLSALFSIATSTHDRAALHRARLDRASLVAHELVRSTPTPGVAFITGPSGAGKSTILRKLRQRLPRAVVMDQLPIDPNLPVIDNIPIPFERACTLLARAGLAEASVFLTPLADLSEGERARLRFAVSTARAMHTGTRDLIADEFLSMLDPETGASTAMGVRRLLGDAGIRMFAASAHEHAISALAPDCLVYQPFHGPPELHTRGSHADTDTRPEPVLTPHAP